MLHLSSIRGRRPFKLGYSAPFFCVVHFLKLVFSKFSAVWILLFSAFLNSAEIAAQQYGLEVEVVSEDIGVIVGAHACAVLRVLSARRSTDHGRGRAMWWLDGIELPAFIECTNSLRVHAEQGWLQHFDFS